MVIKSDKVTVEKIICKKCLYSWYPKIQSNGVVNPPKICPNCHQNWRMENTRKLGRVINEKTK